MIHLNGVFVKVDDVLGDRMPGIEDMKNLKYTTRVINEVVLLTYKDLYGAYVLISKETKILILQTLRLYPQPPVLIRRSLENDVLGEYEISK